MRSYKDIFDEAQEKATALGKSYYDLLPEWRQHPELFHFVMANNGLLDQDDEALHLAGEINPQMALPLLLKGPSGGRKTLDAVECRHILMMSFLQKHLGTHWKNVTEIGGGYGNCLRLIDGIIRYTSWTIVDLDYILELQQWFLHDEKIDAQNIYLQLTPPIKSDVIIAAHSLSEFDVQTFDRYFPYLSNSKWFFYAAHGSSPSRELLAYKMRRIETQFNAIDSLQYEHSNSTMYLFKNKEKGNG